MTEKRKPNKVAVSVWWDKGMHWFVGHFPTVPEARKFKKSREARYKDIGGKQPRYFIWRLVE